MKYMIISDIHGSLYYTKKALLAFKAQKADKLIILGDILYHGPRNPLTKDYNPQEVYTLLNQYQDQIIAVRGNCDSEVDQMVLEFPMMDDYKIIDLITRKLWISHGHLYHENNLPNMNPCDVLINGHFHIHVSKMINQIHYLNPGSIALPKEDSCHSYGTIADDIFMIHNFEQQIKLIYPFAEQFTFYLQQKSNDEYGLCDNNTT